MQETMTVIEHGDGGGPEVLVPGTRPVPGLRDGEILIKVAAAGVNGPDIMQRRGLYPPPKGASDLLGLEVSGTVVSVPDGHDTFRVGDTVCALTNGGGYAEHVAVRADHVLPVPEGVSPTDAAGLCETFFTVWSNVFHEPATPGTPRRHPDGAILLVHGGAGGIGSTAIQLGAAMGLRVFATEAAEGLDFCRALGAERAIDYRSEDFVAIVKEAGGADVVIDIVGGPNIAKNIKAARHDCRIVQLAFNAGSEVTLNLMPVMLKRLVYTGSTLRSRSDAFKATIAGELVREVWPLFAEGRLRTVTDRVLPLAEAAEAHRLMESAGHRGKILLATDRF